MRIAAILLAALPGAGICGEACHEVHAGQGWQDTAFPQGTVVDVYASGSWTAAAGTYDPVGASGHLDAEAERIDQTAAHGALLFEITLGDKTHQGSWALFKTMLDQAGTFRMDGAGLRFRINEPDALLANNAGALTVCMTYAD